MKSGPDAMVILMDQEENEARLLGLLSQLALPMLRTSDGRERRKLIEVEVAPGRWVEIHGASIEPTRLVLWSGNNGTRVAYEFHHSEGCPRWRTEKLEPRVLIDDEARS